MARPTSVEIASLISWPPSLIPPPSTTGRFLFQGVPQYLSPNLREENYLGIRGDSVTWFKARPSLKALQSLDHR